MAVTRLTTEAIEGGTYAVVFSFKDESGNAVTPNSGLKWTLAQADGSIVNSRENVAVASGASVTVVLSGDDLAISGYQDTGKRFLLIEGTYNSTLGSNLPIRDEVVFYIRNLVAE